MGQGGLRAVSQLELPAIDSVLESGVEDEARRDSRRWRGGRWCVDREGYLKLEAIQRPTSTRPSISINVTIAVAISQGMPLRLNVVMRQNRCVDAPFAELELPIWDRLAR